MLAYAARRLGHLAATAVGVSLFVFLLMRLVPGSVIDQMTDPAVAAGPEQVARMRRFFGLDRPWDLQLLDWFAGVVRGDLGHSWRSGVSVGRLVLSSLTVTLELASLAVVFSLVVGVPLGILTALYRDRLPDLATRLLSLAGLSTPVFWQGSMLILVFSLYLRWTPPLEWVSPIGDPVSHLLMMALPTVTLGTVTAAIVVRMTRATMLGVLEQDYIRTARSKGLSRSKVLARHALPNAAIPIITVAGLQLGYLLGGAIVVEEVFSLPGLGRLLVQSLGERDYPVVQGATLVMAVVFMLLNLGVDLFYAAADPRISYE